MILELKANRNDTGEELKSTFKTVTRNELNRLNAPGLYGEALYKLKKNRKVMVKFIDVSFHYKLVGD